MLDLTKSVDFFAVNFEEYHIYHRNLQIIKYSCDYFNSTVAKVISLFLDKVSGQMLTVKEKETIPISMQNLGLYISQNNIDLPVEGKGVDSLGKYLEFMSTNHVPLLRNATELGRSQYTLELAKISDTLIVKAMENLVYQKFGQIACRIFRILDMKQKIDEKMVILD